MKNLPHERTDRPTGLNNRTFGTKGTARSDRNRRRDRLQDCNSGLNTAAVGQHRLHGFRNSMAFDLGGAVLRHETNNDAADDWRHNNPGSKMVEPGSGEIGSEAVIEKEVGEQTD